MFSSALVILGMVLQTTSNFWHSKSWEEVMHRRRNFWRPNKCLEYLHETVNYQKTNSLGEISLSQISSTPIGRWRTFIPAEAWRQRSISHFSILRKPRSHVPLTISQTGSWIFSCDCNYKECWNHQIDDNRPSAYLQGASTPATFTRPCQATAEEFSASGRCCVGVIFLNITLIIIPIYVAMLEIKWSPPFALPVIMSMPYRNKALYASA